jgi:hypothetical protein
MCAVKIESDTPMTAAPMPSSSSLVRRKPPSPQVTNTNPARTKSAVM